MLWHCLFPRLLFGVGPEIFLRHRWCGSPAPEPHQRSRGQWLALQTFWSVEHNLLLTLWKGLATRRERKYWPSGRVPPCLDRSQSLLQDLPRFQELDDSLGKVVCELRRETQQNAGELRNWVDGVKQYLVHGQFITLHLLHLQSWQSQKHWWSVPLPMSWNWCDP